jgi:hypothetical protein
MSGIMDATIPVSSENRSDRADGRNMPHDPNLGVGIWERKTKNDKSFVRRMDLFHEWSYWANVGRIESKKAKWRIVLVGESVARGFLYDPLYTPAMVLSEILQNCLGRGVIEVIDLARLSLGFEVTELAISAAILEPDLVIVFSGNNWVKASFPSSPSDLLHAQADVREKGVSELKHHVENRLARKVTGIVKEVSDFFASRQIPVLWMIPEYNLGDWRDTRADVPHLLSGRHQEWLEYRECAEDALQKGDSVASSEFANKMVALDGGVNSAGYYILSECCRRRKDMRASRQYLELARDAVVWDPSTSICPRTHSLVQDVLRQSTNQFRNNLTVDLPNLFRDHSNGGIPDRKLFLDYCHLTSEGIRIAMCAAASSIIRCLGSTNVPWLSLMGHSSVPGSDIESQAALLAAVHSAHWWQAHDLVHYFCCRAVELSPDSATFMMQFIELQTRRAPALMCRVAEDISSTGAPLMQHFLLRFHRQQLDRVLLEAMSDALELRTINGRQHLELLRVEEHSVNGRTTNLLDYYYNSATVQPRNLEWLLKDPQPFSDMDGAHYYKAFSRVSKFVFIGDMGCSVRLFLTSRIKSPGRSNDVVTVEVNGAVLGKLSIGRQWETVDITVGGETILDGVNEVAVRWPTPEFPGRSGLESAADAMLEQRQPEFYPVWGEIHSFTASQVCRAPVRPSSESVTDAPMLG